MNFEIVHGDYGTVYRGTIEDEDYSSYTAVIYVWDAEDTKFIDGKACSVSFYDPDTYIDFTPADGDFDVDPGVYNGLFKLTKTGVVERTKKFTWTVLAKEPS